MGTSSPSTDSLRIIGALIACKSLHEFEQALSHELIRLLKCDFIGFYKELRIILMSGNPEKELASHGIKRGTLPFLQKPFEKALLIQFVRDALQTSPPALNLSHGKGANDVDWFG